MKIEFLYPESANLFGELGDMEFIAGIFPDAEIFRTKLADKPRFLDETVDFVFIGPMPERFQEHAIERLMPYQSDIKERIEAGQAVLAIANATELFGEYIECDNGRKIEALGVFPFFAKRQMLNRLSDIFLGKVGDLDIVGLKAQFTQLYKTGEFQAFCDVVKGFGLNLKSREEGIRYRNFLGSYVLGPFLISNPLFAEQWFRERFPEKVITIPAYDLAVKAFEKRRDDLHHPKAH